MPGDLTALVKFLLVAALIAACAASPVQAGVGVAIVIVALAAQLSAQNGLLLEDKPFAPRPAETEFVED